MSLVEEISSPLRSHQPSVSAPPHWRLPVLGLLLLCSLATETGFLTNHFYRDGPLFPFMLFFLVGLLLYLATCTTVLTTKGQPVKWRWLELALILGGALALRCMLLGIDPFLSPDSWRYLWDARVTLHGYSPYVYAPLDPLLQPLRDTSYDRMAYHNVPTIYPPGAQAIYLLSYLIAPGSLVALKGVFVLFDLTTCIALTYLLLRRKLDPARVLIYAWCPLPIMEFAIQGHLDVLAITFTVLAMTSNLATWKGSRALTGLLIGLATLAKIYPLLFLVVVLRRRDWTLLLACLATILLGYLPYLILGHGQVLGFFSTYTDEHSRNSGLVPHIMTWINLRTGLFNSTAEHIIEVLLLGGTTLSMLYLRWRERLSMEAALLILLGTIFAISPHIFPWYTTALLPWVAVCLQPLWTRDAGLKPAGLAIAMAWYFPCIIVIHYLFDHEPDWTVYYLVVYDVVLAGVCIAACVGILRIFSQRIHSTANVSWRWLPQSEKLWPGKRDKR